jgi:hypothetical protein
VTQIGFAFSGGGTTKNRKDPCRESMKPVEPQECYTWPRKFESVARNELVRCHDAAATFSHGQIGQNEMYRTSSYPSASSRTVTRRSCMAKVRTWSVNSSFRLVKGLLERASLSTDVRPSLNRLYHCLISVMPMVSSPKTH